MNQLRQNIVASYGVDGQNWLDSLPDRIKKITSYHKLTNLKPLPNLTYHYVLSGFSGDIPIILKLGMDDNALYQSYQTLVQYKGCASVNPMHYGPGYMLMTAVVPGYSLKELSPNKDVVATHTVLTVLDQLHSVCVPNNRSFKSLISILSAFDNIYQNVPDCYLAKARFLRCKFLSDTSRPQKLLHGDLHHDNILYDQSRNQWLAIDPKGFFGDPLFDMTTFMLNPLETISMNLINQRLPLVASHFNVPENAVRQWCFLRAILGWCWSVQDKLNTQPWPWLTEFLYDS
jgi:streptomycin 6-kinase